MADKDPIAEVRAYLAEHDPDVLAAVADVDRSLIWYMQRLTSAERLNLSFSRAAMFIALKASYKKAG